jgi:8-oxo-dGTP pyrophosphatase MutT (NUDIX family)
MRPCKWSSNKVSYPFDDTTRGEIADRCAAFARLAASGAAPALKRAAVTIALVEAERPAGATAFVLTRRTADLRAHRNQWALPGGRCDPGETPAAAALREMHEEVGLHLGADAVLGLLDDYPTRSGYLITPVVVWGGAGAQLRPNAAEVASVHRIPLADVVTADAFDFVTIPESERRVVRVRIGRHLIHAPTAAVIYQFRELIAGRTTRVADLEQPVFAWR